MKTIIIYDSKTSNTKKIAIAISAALNAKLVRAGEEVDFDKYDLIGIGSGTYAGKPSKKIRRLLTSLPNLGGKKAFAFATFGGQRTGLDMIKHSLAESGAKVIGDWGCRGSFLVYINWGRPDERDFKSAKEFAREIKKELTQKASVLK
ncbi:flavodoxin family protein [Patescibacteria group bacterium]